jgi:hypothetical protein
MRSMLFALTLLLTGSIAFAHKDRVESPKALTFQFRNGEKAIFTITNAVVTSITVQIENATYTVPSEICAKLREVNFDSVRLFWNGSYETAAKADYFHIQFTTGPRHPNPTKSYPPIQLLFRNGKFAEARGINLP